VDGEPAFISNATPLQQVRPCDSAPPRLYVRIPKSGTVGLAKVFRASAKDTWSATDPPIWDFGDGTASQIGKKVSHTYSLPGTHTVTVTDSDAVGNTATITKAITITS
jgi:PKD repeat protein